MINRDQPLYAVVFSMCLCALCAAVLTATQLRWRSRIEANENYARTLALVDALGLVAADAPREAVLRASDLQVRRKPLGEMMVWEGQCDGAVIGYAVEVEGRGRYGPIRGILAFSPDRMRIKALRIYEQQETPGLGGRIAGSDWLGQFAGLPMIVDGEPGIIISSTARGPNVVDAITGASKTTHALGTLLNTLIARFLSGGTTLEALDLGLDLDAVTRATPGYPKNLQTPPHLRDEIRRADFMAPPGLVNLALDQAVSSSMEEAPIIGEFTQIVDGIKRSGEFDYVELDPGAQWIQIDLGRSCTLYCIVVWHYYKNPVIYNDVIVRVADDPDFSSGVRELFNNDHDNSSGLGSGSDTAYFARWWGELVDARGSGDGTTGRYVRVYSNGGCAGEDTRFVEIAVYGR